MIFAEQEGGAAGNREETITPFMNALTSFRHSVRSLALASKDVPVLQECDRVRDEVLPPLGIQLDDTKDGNM